MTTMWDESYPPSLFNPAIPVSGVTAGSPGAFVPANATSIPANLVALRADPVVGVGGTNAPTAAWTTGQYVVTGDALHAHWDGATWQLGDAPAALPEEDTSKRARDKS